jgi:hypothetical protein
MLAVLLVCVGVELPEIRNKRRYSSYEEGLHILPRYHGTNP